MTENRVETGRQTRRNRLVAVSALAVAMAMIGAAYAAVPLYFLFCRATT
jgi:cytochrome c oxidase assembly protein subunit 11